MANRTKILIVFLVLVIVVLAGVMVFTFLVKPKVTGYVVEKQTEGVVIAVNSILVQIQQQGFAQIPIDAEGHYAILVLAPNQPGLPAQQTQESPPAQ